MLDLGSPLAEPEALRRAGLDVLLVDALDPSTDFELLSHLHAILPGTRVLVLTDDADEDYQFQAIRQGARGFVSRDCAPEVFARAVKGVAKGEMWIGHGAATRIIGKFLQRDGNEDDDQPVLSRREQEILALLAEGYRNKEIGSILSVSENTIRAHIASLYRKIQVTGRVEAALYYFGKSRKSVRPRPSSLTPLEARDDQSRVSEDRSTHPMLRVAAPSH